MANYRVTYEASARSWALYLTTETPHRLLSFHGTNDHAVAAMLKAKAESEERREAPDMTGQVDGHDPLYQRGFADGQKAANADLLAALEEVERWDSVSGIEAEWSSVMEMIRAAIAKARGVPDGTIHPSYRESMDRLNMSIAESELLAALEDVATRATYPVQVLNALPEYVAKELEGIRVTSQAAIAKARG